MRQVVSAAAAGASAAGAALALLPGCFLVHKTQPATCQEGKTIELGLQEDVRRFAGCERASAIVIRTGATLDLTPLGSLEEITGDLSIGPTVGIDSVAFNGLVRVGGTVRVIDNGSLRGLFLPRLEQAGRLEVDNNAVLSTVSLPRLRSVDGSLVITDNNALELVTATVLQRVGQELVLAGQPRLNLVDMPRIVHMQTIRLERVPKLPADVVEVLTSKAEVTEVKNPPIVLAAPPDGGVSAVDGASAP